VAQALGLRAATLKSLHDQLLMLVSGFPRDVVIPPDSDRRHPVKTRITGNIRWSLAVLGLAVSAACATPGAQNRAATGAANDAVARGMSIVNAADCHDCDTPLKIGEQGPAPDMTRAVSGHPEAVSIAAPPNPGPSRRMRAGAATNAAFAGPRGISYAANLTPDVYTGLGISTEDMFIRATRTGRHRGASRPVAPPMPWTAPRNYSDEECMGSGRICAR
jgi:hypothetical protein